MSHGQACLQEWEAGLPAPEELIPLTQTLIPQDLAIAFKLFIEPPSSAIAFYNPSENTSAPQCFQAKASHTQNHIGAQLVSPMQQSLGSPLEADTDILHPINFLDYGLSEKESKFNVRLWASGAADQQQKRAPIGHDDVHVAGFMGIESRVENGMSFCAENSEGGSSKKLRKRLDTDFEDVDSSVGLEHSNEESAARTLKRPRLVWTPPLHKRFVEAVTQLGIKNAVPKTIMQLMNVDGLTRENVASHLQKYRLYLKRMQGLTSESPSVSDHLFASTPLPPTLTGSPHFFSNHGDDLVPNLMPLPVGTLGAGHMLEKFPSVLSNTDLNLYNGLLQPFPCQRMNQEYVFNGLPQPGSSQRQVLTLFPQNGT